MKGISGVLHEQLEHIAGRSARATATFEAGQLYIGIEGYGDIHGDPRILLVEIADDRLVVRAWTDREREEPINVEIEGARA
jgi:hypothetical protein